MSAFYYIKSIISIFHFISYYLEEENCSDPIITVLCVYKCMYKHYN